MAKLFADSDLVLNQKFSFTKGNKILRELLVRDVTYPSEITVGRRLLKSPAVSWTQSYLQGKGVKFPKPNGLVRAADLFCGSGGLTQGLKFACRSIGLDLDIALACDADIEALEIYQANHGAWLTSGQPAERLVSYSIDGLGDDAVWSGWPTVIEPHLASYLTNLDIVVAGPPCQGHSNLNNHTRRNDNRNLLYLTTVAFVVATGAKICVIENVPEVLNDSHDVVNTARALLVKSGYKIDDSVLSADLFGAAQTRRRHFLVGIRNSPYEFDLERLCAELALQTKISVRQAISDLETISPTSVFDSPAKLSPENRKRISWLFKNDKYDLPDRHRPDCHKNGHTYPSVYGRMNWESPAQTITTGFLTPGRGRYIHPGQQRTITPHEAARLQSFPDSYSFAVPGKTVNKALLTKVIGDAVPPLLAQAVCTVGLAASHDIVRTGGF